MKTWLCFPRCPHRLLPGWRAVLACVWLGGGAVFGGGMDDGVSVLKIATNGVGNLSPARPVTSVPAVPHHYAVILNGDDSLHHKMNAGYARLALILQNYPETNIFTLSPGFEPPTRHRFFQTLRSLTKVATPNDTVVIYTTGHGNLDDVGYGCVALGDGSGVTSKELVECLRELHNPKVIYVGDQCYSGQFLAALAGSGLKCVAVTDADETHEASCFYFAPNFWQAAAGQVVERQLNQYSSFRPVTNRVDSIKGAFNYAVNQNQREGRSEFQKWLFYASPGLEHLAFGD